MSDTIKILRLNVPIYIGVPDEERATRQTLKVSLEFETDIRAAARSDELTDTIDYAIVAKRIQEIASVRPRKLLETLAEEIAQALLAEFPIPRLVLEIEKFILPDSEATVLRIERINSK